MILFTILPVTTRADIGPKPSIHITFENLGDELCYGTLLSKQKSTGPSSAWDSTEENARHNGNAHYAYADLDYTIWNAFVEYEDTDGCYFLQKGWQVNETKKLSWTYYPPSSFKILLYFPESNTFLISGIYERYAFDSYFTVDADITHYAVPDVLKAEKSYQYFWEILSCVLRILITISLELAIAIAFGYRSRQLQAIAGINVITQVLLNVALNLVNYNLGQLAFSFFYALFELIVFVIEAVVLCVVLPKVSEVPIRKRFVVLYTFFGNLLSFGAGFAIARFIPGIF